MIQLIYTLLLPRDSVYTQLQYCLNLKEAPKVQTKPMIHHKQNPKTKTRER